MLHADGRGPGEARGGLQPYWGVWESRAGAVGGGGSQDRTQHWLLTVD